MNIFPFGKFMDFSGIFDLVGKNKIVFVDIYL